MPLPRQSQVARLVLLFSEIARGLCHLAPNRRLASHTSFVDFVSLSHVRALTIICFCVACVVRFAIRRRSKQTMRTVAIPRCFHSFNTLRYRHLLDLVSWVFASGHVVVYRMK